MMAIMYGMMMKRQTRLQYGDFNEMEKIRVWLEYHQEVFTEDFMAELANKFLNYYNVRKKIKELFPRILRMDIIDNIDIIPNDYGEVFKKKN